jgi:enoyl-CoA hydratase/carnithine racemase
MNEIIVARPEPGIASLRINRPEVRTALNHSVRQQLTEHFTALGQKPDIRCIVRTGGDNLFAAGVDLREIAECTPIGGREAIAAGLASGVVADERVQERALELTRTIAAMPPLAAA